MTNIVCYPIVVAALFSVFNVLFLRDNTPPTIPVTLIHLVIISCLTALTSLMYSLLVYRTHIERKTNVATLVFTLSHLFFILNSIMLYVLAPQLQGPYYSIGLYGIVTVVTVILFILIHRCTSSTASNSSPAQVTVRVNPLKVPETPNRPDVMEIELVKKDSLRGRSVEDFGSHSR